MNEEKIINKIMEFGINKYEAMAYLCLLKNPDITAYEISKLSSVPQAKIYETMNRLLDKNLVNVIGDNPTKYIAMELEGFLDNYKNNVEESVDFLKENLKNLNSKSKVSYMWHLEGRDNIIQKIRSIIGSAQNFLYLEAWAQEFDYFAEELKDIEGKGIKIVSIVYGETENRIGTMHFHQMDGMHDEVKRLGRWFTLVIDAKEAVFAVLDGKDKDEAIWTKNKAFMFMAESFISHDIFIAQIYKNHKDELDREFGPNMKNIRKIINVE